jgi:hypothetical protein
VKNQGAHRIALAGRTAEGPSARLGTRTTGSRIQIEYLRDHSESWWNLAGTIARRVGVVRDAFLGNTALLIAGLLLALAWIIAVRLMLQEVRRCAR